MLASRKCTYDISFGLIEMLIAVTGLERQEIWSILADNAQVCFDRIEKNEHQDESWRWMSFPNTEIRLKVKVHGVYYAYNYNNRTSKKLDKPKYMAEVTFSPNETERFTSRQVEEFLVENILLGKN